VGPFSGDADALVGGAPQDVQPLEDVDALFRKLCAAPSGVLSEDALLQVPHRRGNVRVWAQRECVHAFVTCAMAHALLWDCLPCADMGVALTGARGARRCA